MDKNHALFLGLTAEGWVAVWTFALFVATAVLAGVTVFLVRAARDEIMEVRKETRKGRTLEAVQRYDHDPILDNALRNLAAARDSGKLQADPRSCRMDMFIVLNYLETIAIGINQGLYIESMVRDFMEPIVTDHIQEFVDGGLTQRIGIELSDFAHICDLKKKWSAKPTHYKGDE